MDSLTQIVLGAAVGEKFLGKKLGNKALLYGAIAGTIPDLDVYFGKLYDPITAIEIHRGLSHSILFFVVLSPVLGWILSKIERKKQISFKHATLFWFLGLFTHALLDAFTTWGTQLLYPFDIRWSLHSIFVIDPLYTLPFLFCLIMVMRHKREHQKRQKWNNLGILISSSYLLLTVVVQQMATSKFEKQLAKDNIQYTRKIVKPSPLNIILWNSVIETNNGYYLGDYSFLDTQPIAFDFYPKNKKLIEPIENEKVIQQLQWISEGFWLITQDNERLFFNDIRFGMISTDKKNPEFAFSYEIVTKNNSINALEVPNKRKGRMKELLSNLWERIKGN
ncbi:MAG TPA: metal-dependent hydrolase [Flavobacteriaceae bacterium]|nr:metal-dependent hydrolase [Flavobacteriaceae bacterium]